MAKTIWDIRLVCTMCGMRSRRCRNDYDGKLGDSPAPSIETECANCCTNLGIDILTTHFVDIVDDDAAP